MKAMGPGRSCPASYHFGAAALAREEAVHAECLYAVGGVYGNPFALDALIALAASERHPPLMVFNGDFHWFDTDPGTFSAVSRAVLGHTALRGNVETELGSETSGAGCGCAYPDFVGDAEVERSNRILARLRATARALPGESTRLAALPMRLLVEVGGLRIGIVHGDAESLAGWGFSQEALSAAGAAALAPWFDAARVRVFASSHSCLPVAADLAASAGRCALINNGAAGMPNFAGTRCGVITRIDAGPAPVPALYGLELEGVRIEALPLHYDHTAWVRAFLRDWPPGSDAHVSYFRRLEDGPVYRPEQAARGGFRLRQRAVA
ncbi:MAG TPA: hypothetical protein VLC55_13925 [Burkholderiales bacterium]|nr:hypothetical protein [Burkholderiales bacterium]